MPVKFQWLCIWLTLLVLSKNNKKNSNKKVAVFLMINHLLFFSIVTDYKSATSGLQIRDIGKDIQ